MWSFDNAIPLGYDKHARASGLTILYSKSIAYKDPLEFSIEVSPKGPESEKNSISKLLHIFTIDFWHNHRVGADKWLPFIVFQKVCNLFLIIYNCSSHDWLMSHISQISAFICLINYDRGELTSKVELSFGLPILEF